jgi:hypothetical protein
VTLADVLAVISGLALAGAGFACLAVILSLLMPQALDRAGARAGGRPVLSASLGLLIFFASAVIWGTLLKIPFPPARLLAVAGILAVFCFAALGGAGLASRLGRSYSGRIGAGAALDDVLRGVFLLEGAALLPIVGWFVVLPVSFLVCLGAGFQASISRNARQPAAAAAAPQS